MLRRAWRPGVIGQRPCSLRAPAKINLTLQVIGQRPDGYHDLVTRMQKLELCDRIELQLTERPGIICRCDDPNLQSAGDNLAARAADCFLQAAGYTDSCGVEIDLVKRIPVAAGLGGGSSDAGAVLRGLNALLLEPFSERKLIELGCSLGADVPFFVHRAAAVEATGIGEVLVETASLQGFFVLLVNPGFGVSTKTVFENYALTTKGKKSKIRGSRIKERTVFSPANLVNDLEHVAVERWPVIGRIKTVLLREGAAGALMTGSGPTVFGLFAERLYTEASLATVAERLAVELAGTVFLTRVAAGA
jgi:4-diphosphocytidyl-2-C-methyl-D-erythritol kinase